MYKIRTNYDYNESFYQQMHGFKSISEFLTEVRSRKEKMRRKAYLSDLIMKYDINEK